MINYNLTSMVGQSVRACWQKVQALSRNTWVRFSVLGILGCTLLYTQGYFGKKMSWENSMGANILGALQNQSPNNKEKNITATTVSQNGKMWWEEIKDKKIDIRAALNLANEATAVSNALTDTQKEEAAKFSNLGFLLNPGLAERKNVDPAVVAAKNKVVYDYISRYAATAQEEAQIFNIPASITLAQGLLESNCGESNLSKRDNNHFGIKCQDKCIGCRCANYTDDTRYDMFRIFDSAWESFRAHSKLLTGKRYKHLLLLPRTDYRNWAYGLKAAGYATDAKYAEKLIAIVEALDLVRFDK